MNKPPRFTRNEYNAIKRMDRKQMEDWIFEVHNKAYEAGCEDGRKEIQEPELPDLTGLEEAIQKIRGVGGSKARLVSMVVKEYLEGKTAE